MRQDLDKYYYRNGHVIKYKKAISEYGNSDFQFSRFAISFRKNSQNIEHLKIVYHLQQCTDAGSTFVFAWLLILIERELLLRAELLSGALEPLIKVWCLNTFTKEQKSMCWYIWLYWFPRKSALSYLNILVRRSRQSGVARATNPEARAIRNVMPRKALYMSRHMISLYAEANMPTGTGLPLCHKYICRGGSCQEHRGIMFLMAIPSGSVLPEWWLSNSGLLAQSSPEYSSYRRIQSIVVCYSVKWVVLYVRNSLNIR